MSERAEATTSSQGFRVAVLDDYQHVAMTLADWAPLRGRADVTAFHDHIADEDELVERLQGFDAIVAMRERTALPQRVLDRLPRLQLIAVSGSANAVIDIGAARQRG